MRSDTSAVRGPFEDQTIRSPQTLFDLADLLDLLRVKKVTTFEGFGVSLTLDKSAFGDHEPPAKEKQPHPNPLFAADEG